MMMMYMYSFDVTQNSTVSALFRCGPEVLRKLENVVRN